MVELYFTAAPESRVREVMDTTPTNSMASHLRRVEEKGDLATWADIYRLAQTTTAASYATISKWAAGDIVDESLGDEILYATYTTLLGALVGPTQVNVQQELQMILERLSKRGNSQAAIG